jgi:hypothetical protein
LRTSRQVGHAVYTFAAFNARRYSSPVFAGYNRPIFDIQFGVGFSPGDIPVRAW